MEEGAFALLDCLGFKGIWKRGASPEAIIGFLEHTKTNADLTPTRVLHGRLEQLAISVAFVSDTVAISARLKDAQPTTAHQRGFLISVAGQACRDMVQQFMSAPVPLLMRGHVSYGPHLVRDSFFLGPAVDEAASYAEVAQGAFIWGSPDAQNFLRAYMHDWLPNVARTLCKAPTAQRIAQVAMLIEALKVASVTLTREQVKRLAQWWQRIAPEHQDAASSIVMNVAADILRSDSVLEDYPMPLTSGAVLKADILNPLFGIELSRQSAVMEQMLSSISGQGLDIILKRQHTHALLQEAHALTTSAVTDALKRIRPALAELTALTGQEIRFE